MPFYEKQSDGSLIELDVLGEYRGEETGDYNDLLVSVEGQVTALTTPDPPVINATTSTMPTRTTSHVEWIPSPNIPNPAVTSWVVTRRESTNGGTTFGAWSPISGSPFAANVLSANETGLITGTPEVIFQYRVRGVNADGSGLDSAFHSLQWAGTPVSQPTAPTGFGMANLQPTSVQLNWVETADATVTSHEIWQGTTPGTRLRGGLDAIAVQYTLSSLTPNTAYANLNVRRVNPAGTSPPSNILPTFTTPSVAQTARFPGHQPGKIYYGFARLEGNVGTSPGYSNVMDTDGSYFPAGHTTRDGWRVLNGWDGGTALIGPAASARLGVRRFYNKDTSIINAAYADDIMMWLSAKPDDLGASGGIGGWPQIAAGSTSIDNAIRNYFNSLVTLDRPLVFTFHHEPVGDAKPSNSGSASAAATAAGNWCGAWRHILDVFETEYGTNTKIIMAPNIEGFTWRSNVSQVGDLRNWFPDDLIHRWHLITSDLYHNETSDTWASTRLPQIEKWFNSAYTQPGGGTASWLHYQAGIDFAMGLGEHAGRYRYYRDGTSAVSAAKWARDAENYIFARPDIYPIVSWFNSIGAEDERIELAMQAGDTETTMAVYREKALSAITCKISDIGM